MTATLKNPFDISGKNAIVTGGAMGIGFGIVKRFVEAGANVVIADIDLNAAEAAAKKLAEGPGKAVAMRVDVSQEDAGDKMVEKCVKEFGSVDILVNNAGIFPSVPMLEMEPALFDKVIAINLKGLAFASKAAAAQMIKQGKEGKIINIASIDSLHPSMVGLAAYDASKGGVLMFTKNFALEVAPHGILVNAIAPGGITTEGTSGPIGSLTKEQMEQVLDQFKQLIPLGRMGEPDDIAKVTLFLASPAADYMTGEMIVVDGGRLLK
ncbi:MAG: SDR family oxidoreductase [Firmicutes bacterium]|jgi:2-deoxy-D-gluconate 3-dehydrogenase|nr:SDR family oxidoreductase [Bacillota bacterium]